GLLVVALTTGERRLLVADRPEGIERRAVRHRLAACTGADVAIRLRRGDVRLELDRRVRVPSRIERPGVSERLRMVPRAVAPVGSMLVPDELEVAVLEPVAGAAGTLPRPDLRPDADEVRRA